MTEQARRWTILQCVQDLETRAVLRGPDVRASHPEDPDDPVEVAEVSALRQEWKAELTPLRQLADEFGRELEQDADFVFGTAESATRRFFAKLDELLPAAAKERGDG